MSEGVDVVERQIDVAALDSAHVVPVKAAKLRQRLLRKISFKAKRTDPTAEATTVLARPSSFASSHAGATVRTRRSKLYTRSM